MLSQGKTGKTSRSDLSYRDVSTIYHYQTLQMSNPALGTLAHEVVYNPDTSDMSLHIHTYTTRL